MKKAMGFVLSVLILAGTAPGLSAAEKASLKGSAKLQPIQTEFRTIGGLKYMFEDRKLKSYKDFEGVISKAGDPEATRMLGVSRSSRKASGFYGLLGLSAVVAAALTLPDHHNVFDDGTGTSSALLIGGAGLFTVSNFYDLRSQTARFNAVQRYNQVALGAKVASF